MSTTAPRASLRRRLGALPPLYLAAAYTAVLLVPRLLAAHPDRPPSFGPAVATLALLVVASLAVFAVVTWCRDDDTLSAGAIIALIVAGGAIAATVIAACIDGRSLGVAALVFMTHLLAFVVQAIVLFPIATGLVWLARALTLPDDARPAASRKGARGLFPK